MSSTDLVTSLTDLCNTFLTGYGELKYKYNVEDNQFKGSTKKYGVLSGDIDQTDGTTCFLTLDQNFEVIITDSYTSINSNDNSKDSVVKALQDLGVEFYREVVNTKANRPDIVMIISEFSSSIEELDEDKVIVNRMNFTIKYRKPLP